MHEEGFLAGLGASGDARKLAIRERQRQVDAADLEERADAPMNRVEAGHQEIKRLTIQRRIGEPLVEASADIDRGRQHLGLEPAASAGLAHDCREQISPDLAIPDRLQWHGIGRIEQLLQAGMAEPTGACEPLPPALIALAMAFEEKNAERTLRRRVRLRQLLEPGAKLAHGLRSIVDHDERARRPFPVGEVLAGRETRELPPADEAGAPLPTVGPILDIGTQLEREARLARAGSAGEATDGDGLRAAEPFVEGAPFLVPPEKLDRAALRVQEIELAAAVQRADVERPAVATVEGQAGSLGPDTDLVARADDLDEEVVAPVLPRPGPVSRRRRHPRHLALPDLPAVDRPKDRTSDAGRQ